MNKRQQEYQKTRSSKKKWRKRYPNTKKR